MLPGAAELGGLMKSLLALILLVVMAGAAGAADVTVERGPKGARVLVGERRADVTICGRPSLASIDASLLAPPRS